MSEPHAGTTAATDQPPAEARAELPKPQHWWDRWQGKLATIVVTAASTLLLSVFAYWYQNQLATFEYLVSPSASLIQKPKLGDKKMAVTIDGQPVDNLSSVTIYVTNPSGRDFEDVPIEVRMRMLDGSAVNVIAADITPERIENSIRLTAGANRTTVNTYKLDVANRQRKDNEVVCSLTYVFASAQVPEIDLVIPKKGIVAERREIGAKSIGVLGYFAAAVVGIALAVVGGGFVGLMFSFIDRLAQRRRAARGEEPKVTYVKRNYAEDETVEERLRAVSPPEWEPPTGPVNLSRFSDNPTPIEAERQMVTLKHRLEQIGNSPKATDEAEAKLLRARLTKVERLVYSGGRPHSGA